MPDGAIFHMDVKTFSRSQGRSAVAAAAYRAGSKLFDARIGIEFNYKRKAGVVKTFITAPDGCEWITDRNTLWNAAEAAEKRKNSTVAREWLVALPDALDEAQREDLTQALAIELVTRYGVAVDVAIHAPRPEHGDRKKNNRNHHAHLLTTTRTATSVGFDTKTRILDAAKTGGIEIAEMRAWWADMVNSALKAANINKRVEHRRRSVIIAELEAQAKVYHQQAAEIIALSTPIKNTRDIIQGLGKAAHALRESGIGVLTSKEQDADQLIAHADSLLEQAYRLKETPVNTHDGPQLSAYKRRMQKIWDAEAKEKADQEAAEAAKIAQAQKEREIALEQSRLAEKYVHVTAPLIARARQNSNFANRITRWGINLDCSDYEAERNPIWRKWSRAHNSQLILSILTDEAEELDRKARQDAEARRLADVKAFMERQIERASTFPTPLQDWPDLNFKELDPETIQTSFTSQFKDTLKPAEIAAAIRAMLTRWVERIIEDMASLKRGAQSIWVALTGDHIDAGKSLERATKDHPDLAKPLIEAVPELKEPAEALRKKNKPKPPTPSSGPGM